MLEDSVGRPDRFLRACRRARCLAADGALCPLLPAAGWLYQEADSLKAEDIDFTVVSETQPTEQQLADLRFAWRAVRRDTHCRAVTRLPGGSWVLGMSQHSEIEMKWTTAQHWHPYWRQPDECAPVGRTALPIEMLVSLTCCGAGEAREEQRHHGGEGRPAAGHGLRPAESGEQRAHRPGEGRCRCGGAPPPPRSAEHRKCCPPVQAVPWIHATVLFSPFKRNQLACIVACIVGVE